MDSKDRPEPNVPAVPVRISAARPAILETMTFGKTAAAEPTRSINMFRAAMRAVSRHWWQILLLWGLATGGLCYLIMVKVKPKYTSEAVLRVEPSHKDLYGTGMYSAETLGTFMETQVQLIKSSNVLAAAVAKMDIPSLPSLAGAIDVEGELRRLIEVQQVPGSYLLQVQFTSELPKECADIVNEVVRSYLNSSADWTDAATKGQISNLETHLKEIISDADRKQELLLELARKGTIDLDVESIKSDGGGGLPTPTRTRMTINEFRKVKDELNTVDLELTQAEALLAVREQDVKGRDTDARLARKVDQVFRSEPDIGQLLQNMERAGKDLEAKKRLSRNPLNDPACVAAKKKYEDLLLTYDQRYAERKDDILAKLQEDGADQLGMAIRDAHDKVEMLKAKKKGLEERYAKIELTNRTEGTDATKAAFLREDLASTNANKYKIKTLLSQLMFEQKSEARISQVDRARPNGIPVSDNRKKLLAGTPVAVLMFVLGLFVLMEVKIGRVSDLEDLSKLMPVEVFALPPLPGPRLEPGQRGAKEREARLQEFLQSLDHLRVAICDEHVAGTGAGGRCITITSATASEGKTTLSAQLSACCAKAGISTLLIDADMRRATLSRMLNEEKSPGLSELLQGELTPEEAAISIPDAGFHLVPAGSPGRDPSWLLKGQRIGQVLTRYRQLFDLVIIDTPPVLPVPDALTIGRWSDGAILTTRFDVSRFPMVERARRRLSSAGITLLTTVVNGVRLSRFAGYGYGHGYGYGYGGYGAYAYGDRAVSATETNTPA